MSGGYTLYVECGADTNSLKFPFTRKHYMHPSETVLFRNYYNNVGVYSTVMQYINPEFFLNEKQKWVLNARDSLKWGDFYLDFDTPLESDDDLQKIKDDVRVAMKYLRVILSIDASQINLFYSGSKGVHLTVSANVMGLDPHVSLNQIYRDIALEIKEYTKNDTLDVRVYDDKRMFRMVNSFNKKGGRYKIPITHQELTEWNLEKLREVSLNIRTLPEQAFIPSARAKKSLDIYIKKWTERQNTVKEYEGKIKKLKRLPPCIKAMQDNIFRETVNERNNSGTAMASFFMQQGMDREEAMARMIHWGAENCSPPLAKRDMETIVNSVYNGKYRYGCNEFHRLSGVCDKANCPIFNKALNTKEEEEKEQEAEA